jgi:nifR3 family TIM-barrel protein
VNTHAALVRRGGDKPYAVQLFASEPEAVEAAAALLAPLRPDAVDINAGCPVSKVVKNGAGAALMRKPALLGRVTAAAVRAASRALGGAPVTVKMRSGWDAASVNCLECARAAVDAGAALVTLHPRTRAQGYGGVSDWSLLARLAAALPVPVAGSGDLRSPEDAARMLRETGCAAVMFARGALGNPFIFPASRAFLRGEPRREPSARERAEAALRHLRLLAGDMGEDRACREMRKQFCAYTKGFPGGAALRNRLVRASSIADYEAALTAFRGTGEGEMAE